MTRSGDSCAACPRQPAASQRQLIRKRTGRQPTWSPADTKHLRVGRDSAAAARKQVHQGTLVAPYRNSRTHRFQGAAYSLQEPGLRAVAGALPPAIGP